MLEKYNPKIDSTELTRLGKEHKIDSLTLDGEKTYFKNCVRNVLLLDSVYAKLKIQKEEANTDSLTIFRLNHTAKGIGRH